MFRCRVFSHSSCSLKTNQAPLHRFSSILALEREFGEIDFMRVPFARKEWLRYTPSQSEQVERVRARRVTVINDNLVWRCAE